MFPSESPCCAAVPCGRKTRRKAHPSHLWVAPRASRRLQPESSCVLLLQAGAWAAEEGGARFPEAGLTASRALSARGRAGCGPGLHCCGLFSLTCLHINSTDAPVLQPGAAACPWPCPQTSLFSSCFLRDKRF